MKLNLEDYYLFLGESFLVRWTTLLAYFPKYGRNRHKSQFLNLVLVCSTLNLMILFAIVRRESFYVLDLNIREFVQRAVFLLGWEVIESKLSKTEQYVS